MLDHQSNKMTSTSKIIEMLRNRRKYSRFNSESVENILRGLSTYVFAHAKVKRSVFYSKILKFVLNIGIIFNYLQSWFFSIIKNWVWFTWVGNLGIPGIKPYKLGCVVWMVVDSILPRSERGPNDHRKDVPLFTVF